MYTRQELQSSSVYHARIDPWSPTTARHARFLTLADIYLGVRVFFSLLVQDNGAIRTIHHHSPRYYYFLHPCTLDNDMEPPACTLLSSRGTRLQHGTPDYLPLTT